MSITNENFGRAHENVFEGGMKLLKQPGDHTDTSVVVGQRLFRLHPRAPSQVDHLEAGGH